MKKYDGQDDESTVPWKTSMVTRTENDSDAEEEEEEEEEEVALLSASTNNVPYDVIAAYSDELIPRKGIDSGVSSSSARFVISIIKARTCGDGNSGNHDASAPLLARPSNLDHVENEESMTLSWHHRFGVLGLHFSVFFLVVGYGCLVFYAMKLNTTKRWSLFFSPQTLGILLMTLVLADPLFNRTFVTVNRKEQSISVNVRPFKLWYKNRVLSTVDVEDVRVKRTVVTYHGSSDVSSTTNNSHAGTKTSYDTHVVRKKHFKTGIDSTSSSSINTHTDEEADKNDYNNSQLHPSKMDIIVDGQYFSQTSEEEEKLVLYIQHEIHRYLQLSQRPAAPPSSSTSTKEHSN